MNLMPEHLRRRLPSMGSDLETPLSRTRVQARYVDPVGNWRWYAIEFDGDDTFFGLVVTGSIAVPGQFTLSELEGIVSEDPEGGEITIQLDEEFSPCTVEELCALEPAVGPVIAEASPRERHLDEGLVDLE